jgi:hypothetical protein
MTGAAGGLVASTAVASALLIPAAVQGRPNVLPRVAPAHAASVKLAVSPLAADAITATSATLRAEVIVAPRGANVTFQYGTTTSYGQYSATATTSLVAVAEQIRTAVAGLSPSTTYHYRAVVWSGKTATYGRDQWFTTPAPGAAPAAADQGADPTDTGTTVDTGSGDLGDGGSGSGSGSDTATDDTGSPADDQAPATDDSSGPAAQAPRYDGPRPVLGERVGAQAVKGTVTILSPAGAPVSVTDATTLPTGTIVDTTKGTVALTSATDAKGTTQTGQFWGGVFEVRQSATGKGMTQLVLRGGDFAQCPPTTVTADAAAGGDAAAVAGASRAAVRAHAAATTRTVATRAATQRKPPRRLWGSDKNGRFQTRGRGSVATVRGTRWVTEDWCQGTVTRVHQGAVSVNDLHLGHARLVKQGRSYFARVGDGA